MASINARGVVVGGLVAGLIINISEYILNVPVLGSAMAADLAAHNLPPVGGTTIAVFTVVSFVVGIVLVWLYAAIRTRYGAGPGTAVIAGLTVWFLDYFCSSVAFVALGVASMGITVIGLVWGLVELVIAALAGGWLYSET